MAFLCMRRVDLVSDVLQDTPEAQGRLLIDLINEPDGYSLTWEVRTFQDMLSSKQVTHVSDIFPDHPQPLNPR